jgi:hypothetical protein
MHGAGGSAENWFGMNFDNSGSDVGEGDFVALVDYLIASGKMEPTIFVSATIATDMENYSKAIKNRYTTTNEVMNFGYELKYDLIPAIEGTYSTYAEGTDLEALKASKDHRAFGGLSMGANVTWNAIVTANDVITYFAPLANGAAMGDDQIGRAVEMLEELKDADLSGMMVFSSAGTKDHCYEPQNTLEQYLLDNSNGQFSYGENIVDFVPVNGTHTAKYFTLGVVNAMKFFFK